MKLLDIRVTLNKTFIAVLVLLFLVQFTFSAGMKKVENEDKESMQKSSAETDDKLEVSNEVVKKKTRAKQKVKVPKTAKAKSKNTTKAKISQMIYDKLNTSFSNEELKEWKPRARTWDFKLLDKQIEDIYQDMNFKLETKNNPTGKQSFVTLFVKQYEACDKNGDNILHLKEFTRCMKTDAQLKLVIPPTENYASYTNFTFTNSTGFYPLLFSLLDQNHNNYLTFYEYMVLRLFVFSWRYCSTMAPFISEVGFECALEIASGYKTLSRNSLRRIFNLGLEISNSESIRNLDFMTYAAIASGVRLYGKINGKEDLDITKSEMNLALDSNILPMRYNQEIIDNIFHLIEEFDRPNQGIDVNSFVFYDFYLRIYEVPQVGEYKLKKYRLSRNDFYDTLNHFLFPTKIKEEIKKVPRNNVTEDSYLMYTYWDKQQYSEEKDHFLRAFTELEVQTQYVNENRFETAPFRFKQINSKTATKQQPISSKSEKNVIKFKYQPKVVSDNLFNILDGNGDGYINFYDWGNFLQIAYLYSHFDVNKNGKITAEKLYEMFTHYSDFPVVTRIVKERAKRFNLIPAELYIDIFHAILILRIDDLIKTSLRRVDSSTLFEFELKNIFAAVNMRYVPDTYLNKCLRGTDNNNLPLYEWECAFLEALVKTLTYYESSYAYLTTANNRLKLSNTAFMNTDPQLSKKKK